MELAGLGGFYARSETSLSARAVVLATGAVDEGATHGQVWTAPSGAGWSSLPDLRCA